MKHVCESCGIHRMDYWSRCCSSVKMLVAALGKYTIAYLSSMLEKGVDKSILQVDDDVSTLQQINDPFIFENNEPQATMKRLIKTHLFNKSNWLWKHKSLQCWINQSPLQKLIWSEIEMHSTCILIVFILALNCITL